jgi:hypothetical protein
MRTILAIALLALAGFLIWHGIAKHDEAKAEFDRHDLRSFKSSNDKPTPPPDFSKLFQLYPYSNPAIDARELTLESQIHARETAAAGKTVGKEELKALALEIPDRTKKGISGESPYVQPDAAAIIGVAGLLLALVMPGTRFRGLAFLGLLFGAAAALVGMLPTDNQVGLIQKFGPLKYVIASFPRVAQACVALAAITLAAQVRRVTRGSP